MFALEYRKALFLKLNLFNCVPFVSSIQFLITFLIKNRFRNKSGMTKVLFKIIRYIIR